MKEAGRIGAVIEPSRQVQVSYTVTNKQRLSPKVLDLQYFDTEEGLPFVIALNATNEGNVDATPTLKVRLSDLNNATVLTHEISNITPLKDRQRDDFGPEQFQPGAVPDHHRRGVGEQGRLQQNRTRRGVRKRSAEDHW